VSVATEGLLAWHFLPEDRRLRWGTQALVEPDTIYYWDGPLAMCESGLHASVRALDALRYAPGPIVCRVRMWGEMIKEADKICAREREVLWMADASRILHEFACDCAERALKLAGVTDERCWKAIEAKREWLRGEASDEELSVAWTAARQAAWEAVEAAAWTAARLAAETAAPEAAGAAEAAAGTAALEAAQAAAWTAAWLAARTDARTDAWTAAGEAQNRKLTTVLERLEAELASSPPSSEGSR